MSISRGRLVIRVFVAVLTVTAPVLCQPRYVSRYDAYLGYAHLNSPAIKLPAHGIQAQIGIRPTTWYSLGFDYSNARGDLTLTPNLLPTALQQSLGAQLAALAAAGRLPAGYSLIVPAGSTTQTFAVGPQLAFRHFRQITFLLRPSIGYIREAAVPKPQDAIATGVVKQLVPSGSKVDWTRFYGVGGGIDLNFSKHVSLRIQGDYVYDHLFPDILQNGRRTIRFSFGPAFNFGKNIVE